MKKILKIVVVTILSIVVLLILFLISLFSGVGFHTYYLGDGANDNVEYVNPTYNFENKVLAVEKIFYFGRKTFTYCAEMFDCNYNYSVWVPIYKEEIIHSKDCELTYRVIDPRYKASFDYTPDTHYYSLDCHLDNGQDSTMVAQFFDNLPGGEINFLNIYYTNKLKQYGFQLPTAGNPVEKIISKS